MQNTRSTLMGLGVIICLLSAEDLAFCLFMPSDEMIFLSVACVPLPVCALLKVGAFGIDFRRLNYAFCVNNFLKSPGSAICFCKFVCPVCSKSNILESP